MPVGSIGDSNSPARGEEAEVRGPPPWAAITDLSARCSQQWPPHTKSRTELHARSRRDTPAARMRALLLPGAGERRQAVDPLRARAGILSNRFATRTPAPNQTRQS